MKKLLTLFTAICLCSVVCFSGCISGKDGVDGQDGSDVSIVEIWNEVNAARAEDGLEELSFLDFVSEYLSYDSDELSQSASLKGTINRSLMSCVTILTNFNYTTTTNGGGLWGATSSITYNEIYTGSGVIISVDKEAGDAYIVTNCHVVYSSSSDEVFCNDIHLYLYGKEDYTVSSNAVSSSYYTYEIEESDWGMTAELVAASITYDLALLKVEGSDTIKKSDVYAASFIDDDIIEVGDTVYAIGNAEGEGMGVTTGIISVDSEYIDLTLDDENSDERSYRVLRTDAAVNSGNSGGGLFNTDGQLVGIVNAKTGASDVDNMGYAIPASTARRVIANMLENEGTVSASGGLYKGLLGITVQTDLVSSGLDSNGVAYRTEAAVVYSIENDSMAYGKLQENDVIAHLTVTGADGTVREDMDVTRVYLLTESMISVRKNDTVTLTVKRDGEYFDIDFTFTELTHVD